MQKPILVGGIFNTTNPSVYEAKNKPNPVKEKINYYFKDLKDWSNFRNIIINHDDFGKGFSPEVFPVNSVRAMRGAFMFLDQGILKITLIQYFMLIGLMAQIYPQKKI